jgi:hypothetical protein
MVCGRKQRAEKRWFEAGTGVAFPRLRQRRGESEFLGF